jgi:hypothetical protein
MNENSILTSRFNNEGTRSFWEWRIHDRVADAIERLDARFILCEPQLASARYRDLLDEHGHPPALRPFFQRTIQSKGCGPLPNSGRDMITSSASTKSEMLANA